MPDTLDEALTSATETADSNTLVIDNDLRTITVPPDLILGVYNDDKTHRLPFKMPKMFGDIDLSTFSIRVNYTNAANETDMYLVEDATVSGDNINFTWLVGRTAFQAPGTCQFSVCLRDVDSDGVVQREFNTTVASLEVLTGIEGPEPTANPEYMDVVTQLSEKFSDLSKQIEQKITDETTRAEKAEQANSDAATEVSNALKEYSGASLQRAVENYYAMRRTGKKFSAQIPIFASNSSSICTKIGINADLNWKPATDSDAGTDDYESIPLFQWVHVVYKRNSDGSPYPVAIEGSAEYNDMVSERKCDVGAMQMSLYIAIDGTHTADGYHVMTISDLPFEGSQIWSECKKADDTKLPWCIGSSYISSLGADGLLHSLPDGHPEKAQSYNNMITNYAKKGDGYQGAGAERHFFQWIFEIIKGATKSSSTLFTGCCNYSFQYTCAVAEENVKRVIVTTAQGANFVVGANVMIGNTGSGTSTDRGVASMSSIAAYAKVLSTENVTINDTEYTAVNLDLESEITTTTSTYVSSIHWDSGSTDAVIGHRDGSLVSNTDSKHPYRVQGREYMVGGYEVASDTVMEFTEDYGKNVYVYPKGVKHVANSHEGATLIGKIPGQTDGADFSVGDITVDLATGGFFPSSKGGSTANGVGDTCYAGGKTTSGLREFLMGGSLWSGSGYSGFGFLNCWVGLSNAGWSCLSAD